MATIGTVSTRCSFFGGLRCCAGGALLQLLQQSLAAQVAVWYRVGITKKHCIHVELWEVPKYPARNGQALRYATVLPPSSPKPFYQPLTIEVGASRLFTFPTWR